MVARTRPLGVITHATAFCLLAVLIGTGCRQVLGIKELQDPVGDGGGGAATEAGGSGQVGDTSGRRDAGDAASAHPDNEGGSSTTPLGGDSGQTGRGQAAAILSIAPLSATFSNYQLFAPPTTPLTTTFIVTNSGDMPGAALTTTLSPGIGTGSTEFNIASDTCNSQSLAATSTCHVVVQFAPTSHGAKSGSLKVDPGALSASFSGTAADQVWVTVTKAGAGSGTVTDASGSIACGSTCTAYVMRTTVDPVVTLTAAPDAQSAFAGWSGGGCSGTATTCQVTLSADTNVTALFNPLQSTLTVNFHGIGNQAAKIASSPSGIACSSNCTESGKFTTGAKVTLTVTQAADAKIAWSNGCSGTSCEITKLATPTTVNVTSTNQNIAFITSQGHAGDFGGLSGANAYCNAAAVAAGVPGNFVAFLGTVAGTGAMPYQALGSARGWIRIDGLPFIDTVAGFQSNVQWYPASLDEFGNLGPPYHYTGYYIDTTTAAPSTTTCHDWTSSASNDTAIAGTRGEGSEFVGAYALACAGSNALACFGTDFMSPVSVAPASGRLAFVTSSAFDASQGLAAADALCRSSAQTAGLANSNNFRAALATTTASIASRLNLSGAPWVRTDGVTTAASVADFMAGDLIAPIGVDEFGKPNLSQAWLGSTHGATAAATTGAENCNDWSTSSGSSKAIVFVPLWGGPGDANTFGEITVNRPVTCDSGLAVLCLEN